MDDVISIIRNISNDRYSYFEIFMVTLAGEIGLKETIPNIIEFLGYDEDLICQEAMYALSKMGTIEIVDSIASDFLSRSLDFKLFSCSVLGDIKLERSEEVLLDLLAKESDIIIITYIAYSLCKLLSCRAIPELQKLLPDKYDTSVFNLEELLYINATMK